MGHACGVSVFRGRARLPHHHGDILKLWVTDDANDVCCVKVLSRARVKQTLDSLYSDQLHRGDRNGLQRQRGAGNRLLWNFTDVDPSRPVGTDGARFEREMVKLTLAMFRTLARSLY